MALRRIAGILFPIFIITMMLSQACTPTQYTLTTSVSPAGAGTVTPAGGLYEADTEVTLTATAAEGCVFDSWSGGASGTSASITVTMDADKSVIANFLVEELAFVLSSTAFQEGEDIPVKYSCDGQDVSPALSWSGVPQGTQTFVLILDDPDAPGGAFTHWVLFNIPADTLDLSEGIPAQAQLADGARQGINDFGQIGYGGPCPPIGSRHQYRFTIYAIDKSLDLMSGATKQQVLDAIQGYILDQAQLTGMYQR